MARSLECPPWLFATVRLLQKRFDELEKKSASPRTLCLDRLIGASDREEQLHDCGSLPLRPTTSQLAILLRPPGIFHDVDHLPVTEQFAVPLRPPGVLHDVDHLPETEQFAVPHQFIARDEARDSIESDDNEQDDAGDNGKKYEDGVFETHAMTADISTVKLDIDYIQKALRNHDSWMEEVSNTLQQMQEKDANSTEEDAFSSKQMLVLADIAANVTRACTFEAVKRSVPAQDIDAKIDASGKSLLKKFDLKMQRFEEEFETRLRCVTELMEQHVNAVVTDDDESSVDSDSDASGVFHGSDTAFSKSPDQPPDRERREEEAEGSEHSTDTAEILLREEWTTFDMITASLDDEKEIADRNEFKRMSQLRGKGKGKQRKGKGKGKDHGKFRGKGGGLPMKSCMSMRPRSDSSDCEDYKRYYTKHYMR